MPTVRTGESTCIGHPDKLCDLIADTILDDLLVTDPAARCAVEVMATKGRIIAAGVSTSLEARDGNESAFVLTGAGDQGTVYGYATDVEAVVVSIQHTKDTDLEELRRQVTTLIITPAFVSTVTTCSPG